MSTSHWAHDTDDAAPTSPLRARRRPRRRRWWLWVGLLAILVGWQLPVAVEVLRVLANLLASLEVPRAWLLVWLHHLSHQAWGALARAAQR
ncbi:MAG: hypothetical protein K6U14_01705 [Firmicutes bacterium]|nr:hypothetical protein [Alicyclobacillaceae bacterium]MCL6496334.1 hypothetical protein [Bacillota bacterium]